MLAFVLKYGRVALSAILSIFGWKKDDTANQLGASQQKLQDIQASQLAQEKVNATPYTDSAAVDDSLRDGRF